MKISFQCNSCGKSYSVSEQLAGRKAKCKKCDQVMVVPQPEEPEVLAEIDEEDIEIDPAVVASAVATATAALNRGNEEQTVISGTVASNPGGVKVSKLRYIRSYPKWFWIWHGLLLISFGLCFVSLGFSLAVLFFAFCSFMYWKRVTAQFKHGCANPAQVVSFDPPLIAVNTNLSKGMLDTNIIKIAPQPIAKFSTGMPSIGQKVPTVALYEDRFPESEHWSSFDPKPVNLVTGNEATINQVLSTFTNDDWKELTDGLAQLQKPYTAGHYRIYEPSEFEPRPRPSLDQIKQIVMSNLAETDRVYLFQAITQEMLAAISQFMPQEAVNCAWGIVSELGEPCSHAFVFTDMGVFYNFKDSGAGRFGYNEVVGGLSSDSGFELMLRGGTWGRRLQFAKSNFLRKPLGKLDTIFDAISGREI